MNALPERGVIPEPSTRAERRRGGAAQALLALVKRWETVLVVILVFICALNSRASPYFLDVHNLFDSTQAPGLTEVSHVQRIKKYMNYLGVGVEPSGEFLHRVRRVARRDEFLTLCAKFLDHQEPMPLEPFPLALHQADVMAGEQR